MTQKTIYIAGPMRGIKHFNFPAFDQARDELLCSGWKVISPADLDRAAGFDSWKLPEGYDWLNLEKIDFVLRDAIVRDVGAILECDAIFMLRGWRKSRGATAEKAIAEWLGISVLYQCEESTEGVLEEAIRITSGDRQASYGPPDQDFRRTAAMWSAIKGVDFEPREVALFMIALKLSRETHQRKRDNAVDIAGYAKCLDACNQGGAS